MQDFFAESVTTRVIIPEGSSDVQVSLGRLTASISDDRTFTYLDTMIGRPTKIIQVPACVSVALHLSADVCICCLILSPHHPHTRNPLGFKIACLAGHVIHALIGTPSASAQPAIAGGRS